MPVKYWSRAGLMLTDWCNAACASCYLSCSPAETGWMDLDLAMTAWEGLVAASPHGCGVHLSGGEPFGRFDLLLALARSARREGLGPLESVETNAFWATGERDIRDRLGALDAAGMGRLAISADPFHQQFVPIERPRRLARIARERLGPGRVRVRWEDWLADGFDLAGLDPHRRREVFADYLAGGRDRLNARAADRLGPVLPGQPVEHFEQRSCREALLRSKHVHVLPDGTVMPGVCAGIALGRVVRGRPGSVGELWRALAEDADRRPVLGALLAGGPVALAQRTGPDGFQPDPAGYPSACALCWSVRKTRFRAGHDSGELAPSRLYRNEKTTIG